MYTGPVLYLHLIQAGLALRVPKVKATTGISSTLDTEAQVSQRLEEAVWGDALPSVKQLMQMMPRGDLPRAQNTLTDHSTNLKSYGLVHINIRYAAIMTTSCAPQMTLTQPSGQLPSGR